MLLSHFKYQDKSQQNIGGDLEGTTTQQPLNHSLGVIEEETANDEDPEKQEIDQPKKSFERSKKEDQDNPKYREFCLSSVLVNIAFKQLIFMISYAPRSQTCQATANRSQTVITKKRPETTPDLNGKSKSLQKLRRKLWNKTNRTLSAFSKIEASNAQSCIDCIDAIIISLKRGYQPVGDRDGAKVLKLYVRGLFFVVKKQFGEIGCGIKVRTRHIGPQQLRFKFFRSRS